VPADDPRPGPEPDAVVEPDAAPPTEAEDAATAAALALARARKAAADKGLRPGLRPLRSRRRTDQPRGTPSGSAPDARDPMLLGEQLDRLLADRGWEVDVAVGSVIGRWPQIVGPEIADHVQPVSFEHGVLTLRAESTAWATQMRLLTSMLLGRLEKEVGAGTVTEIAVTGPSAPSWSKGRRRAPGRGPRDTYG
jgi:predicted nucleic acid-binding Zn ribbon protein